MNKKVLLITVIVLLVVLGVAAVLYPKLSAGMQPQQLATMPAETTAATESQPEETTEATESAETTAATEATEPEPVFVPDFTVLDWDGNEVKLSDYFGKPIVLNFWAHWCGPCQREMPEFNAVYEELGGEVTFLMVHVGAAIDDGKEKVTEGGYTFPVVFDDSSMAAAFYGVNAFPTSFFINADGTLEGYYVGVMDRGFLQQCIDLIYTAE